VNGDAEEAEGQWPGRSWMEFDELFGPLDAARLDADLAKLAAGPPWQPVRPRDIAGLLAAYRQARLLADELRTALLGVGLSDEALPELCGSVDAQGRPVVVLGTLSAVATDRLIRALGGGQIPPAGEGNGMAA
jgi:hypothetical protein